MRFKRKVCLKVIAKIFETTSELTTLHLSAKQTHKLRRILSKAPHSKHSQTHEKFD